MCEDDGGELEFDPFAPFAQRCARCGRRWEDEIRHGWWVYWYQLWLAERALHLALLFGLTGEARLGERASQILAAYAERYLSYPNADNVLGPSRPFFSTYLESIWVLQLAAAADLLRDLGRLPSGLARDLETRLFRPSAELIADFDEGRSNRQVWNAVALYALGAILGDGGLRQRAAYGRSGITASIENGFLGDGAWYEGENYHWFALRGAVWGAELLRAAGEADLWDERHRLGPRLRAAFRAPVLTALPDFTFPARRDSKFGVTLRQRRFAELWEIAWVRTAEPDLPPLLHLLYDERVPEGESVSWREVTEVERTVESARVRRDRLGWKALLWMAPELPPNAAAARPPPSAHLTAIGLAIFRRREGSRYVSLDYGDSGGGHGHPDRLNLTLHADGVPWLVDFGTGSYVTPDLAWYRSTAAHNAPLVDGVSQESANGVCLAFEERGDFGWIWAALPTGTAYDVPLDRTVIVTPTYTLDLVRMAADTPRTLGLPWHGLGDLVVEDAGLVFERPEGRLRIWLAAPQPARVEIVTAPGPPGTEPPELDFALVSAEGGGGGAGAESGGGADRPVTLAACLDADGEVEGLRWDGDDLVVLLAGGETHRHARTLSGWRVVLTDPEGGEGHVVDLAGRTNGLAGPDARERALAHAGDSAPAALPALGRSLKLARAPKLDGTLAGIRTEASLELNRPDQFRRAEEPWAGPDDFSATAYLNHHESTIYLAVAVRCAGGCLEPRDEPEERLDNENPDINRDGLQVYLETEALYGFLLVPDPLGPSATGSPGPGRLRVHGVRGTDGDPEMVTGGWAATDSGYLVTIAIELPSVVADEFGFDLYVNRARPDRLRRVGQLVFSGARGTRLYLAGDRPLPGPLARIEVEG